jgi:hypothetical protein
MNISKDSKAAEYFILKDENLVIPWCKIFKEDHPMEYVTRQLADHFIVGRRLLLEHVGLQLVNMGGAYYVIASQPNNFNVIQPLETVVSSFKELLKADYDEWKKKNTRF